LKIRKPLYSGDPPEKVNFPMSRPALRFIVILFVGLATAAFALAQRQPAGGAGTAERPRGGAGAGAGAAPAANRESRSARATFEVYKDKAGEFRWRLRATNTQILAIAAQGYSDKRACMNAIESIKRDVANAPVEEKDQTATAKEGKDGQDTSGAGTAASSGTKTGAADKKQEKQEK
jgi:uncharacterized protein YegP (UPF0339 family)